VYVWSKSYQDHWEKKENKCELEFGNSRGGGLWRIGGGKEGDDVERGSMRNLTQVTSGDWTWAQIIMLKMVLRHRNQRVKGG
jgi:hypothetical protein